jgi:hypothetical protein
MRVSRLLVGTGLVVFAGLVGIEAQNVPAGAGQAPAAPAVPQVTLEPGLRPVPDYRKLVADPPAPVIPEGFTSIFNGRDLTGWRVSTTARHGVTPDFHVAHGMILGTQRPLGGGGLLLTERSYRNFELHMEVKPDWGNDSGILFRTTPEGVAYQITLDYLPGGSMGRMIGEGGIQGTVEATTVPGAAVAPAPPAGGTTTDPGMAAWKREDWNTVRLRVQGEVPRATVWINGQLITDAVDSANHAVRGLVEAPIALQIHGGTPRWQPGGFWRWRNIAIRELN